MNRAVPVAKRKLTAGRDRIDIRADPAWIRQVWDEAKRRGFKSMTAYIYWVVTQDMNASRQAERSRPD